MGGKKYFLSISKRYKQLKIDHRTLSSYLIKSNKKVSILFYFINRKGSKIIAERFIIFCLSTHKSYCLADHNLFVCVDHKTNFFIRFYFFPRKYYNDRR